MRALRIVLAAAVALTALIGLAHTPPCRPLLAWMGAAFGHAGGGAGSCPLGYDRAATPAQKEAARARFAVSHAGAVPAPRRPALGFSLDTTTRADVTGWASSHGVVCAPARAPPT